MSCSAAALPPRVADWAFALCKANMQALYDTAWGWDDAEKRAELAAAEARYIVVYTLVRCLAAQPHPPAPGCGTLRPWRT